MMENRHLDLMEIKAYYEEEISKLELSHTEWISFAAEEKLNNASKIDITEEERLGQKSEKHVLASAKDIVNDASDIAKNIVKAFPSKKSVEMLNSTCPWKIDSLGCHPVKTETLNISDVKGGKLQQHEVRWLYGNKSADNCIFLWAVAKYETKEIDGSISDVANIEISLEVPEEIERYFVGNEMSPLVNYCCGKANLPLFFTTSASLFKRWEERQHVIRKLNLQRECQGKSTDDSLNDFSLKFVNSTGVETVKVYWAIKYDIHNRSIKESIIASFSHSGRKLAEEYNIPEELLLTGRYDSWSPEELVTNVARMVHHENSNAEEFVSNAARKIRLKNSNGSCSFN